MPNKRLSRDIATVKAQQGIEQKVTKSPWQNLVDEANVMIFPAFYKTKNAIVELMCKKMRQLEKAAFKPTKRLWQDNARENKKLEEQTKSSAWQFETHVEYTVRSTPQQN